MVMSMFYDRTGKPLKDVLEWAKLREDREYWVLGEDRMGGYDIVTYWEGLDRRNPISAAMNPRGPAEIFETMVFCGTASAEMFGAVVLFPNPLLTLTRTYALEDQAIAGHREVLAQVDGLIAAVSEIH